MPYWPELHNSKEVGPYVVSCTLEREATDYKVRVLEIAPVDKVTLKHSTLLYIYIYMYIAGILLFKNIVMICFCIVFLPSAAKILS